MPDGLEWLEPTFQGLLRPAAYISPCKGREAPQGGTRTWGLPDLPMDASWARFPKGPRHSSLMPWAWGESPYDGESFWLQLNLEDVPAEVRRPEWPAYGVVWVFIDLRDRWEARTRFDPRPASEIRWQPRLDDVPPAAAAWTVSLTAPDCSAQVMPDLAACRDLAEQYEDWVIDAYVARAPSNIQVGGWVWPCQGDFDTRNQDFVCALSQQPFGDSGCVSLHYSTVRGFYAHVETH